jgi:hypothetical protein
VSNAQTGTHPSPGSILSGPVSEVLEADLRNAVRRHGIVVWLDASGHYSGFVDRLIELRRAGALNYEVRGLRGSWLRLLLSLEGLAGGTEKPPLLIHVPGYTQETVRETPLLELYEAGHTYRKALETLVTDAASGRVRPDEITAFKSQVTQDSLTLDRADAWLGAHLDGATAELAPLLRDMRPKAALDDLLMADGPLSAYVKSEGSLELVWERWETLVGLPAIWRETALPTSGKPAPKDIAFAVASWALAVEYASGLEPAPTGQFLGRARVLPGGVVTSCKDLAEHLRQKPGDLYERIADETEALLADEIEPNELADGSERVEETFRFQEQRVLERALDALEKADWRSALSWANARVSAKAGAEPFWVRVELPRQHAWKLVRTAAELGQAISRAGEKLGARTLETALAAYVERGADIDRSHRHLEQQRAILLYPQLPEFERLRERLDAMRLKWRSWADAWARDFNVLCRAEGFLPLAELQQRTIFDEVVRPMAQESGITAYFLIDAFRFEMAEDLAVLLAAAPAPSTSMQLKARLAELPTITALGMNVLAPVAANGRLKPVSSGDGDVRGFSTGEFQVVDPATRKKAMHERVGGTTCPMLSLSDVVGRSAADLKRSISKARLVVVHSQEIDDAGESGVGLVVFDQVIQKLRAAWHLLRDAGVRRFVFTSDHGFLLNDDTSASAQTHGRRIDPCARYVFSSLAADHTGEARVALADLGYEGALGHVMFPDTTAVFDTGRRRPRFVHGGNSLQERVIPVLSLIHRTGAGAVELSYVISGRVGEPVAGMHCLLDVVVEVAEQHALPFGAPEEIDLALSVPNRDDIQVELCEAPGAARIAGGSVHAKVGVPFQVLFRLAGHRDERVLVELNHPSAAASVESFRPDTRFAVSPRASAVAAPSQPASSAHGADMAWLADIPEWVRQVFHHLATHGTITEDEASALLGGARNLRRLAVQFETLAQKAPFSVRIDVVAGVKRYVREGNA